MTKACPYLVGTRARRKGSQIININVDLSDLLELKNLDKEAQKVLDQAARDLTAQTHAHIVESVQNELHSTREKYLGAMTIEQVEEGVWVINLDQKAMWLEEGMEPHSMLDDLLKSPKAKIAKDGSKYLVVPFEQNKKPTATWSQSKDLNEAVRKEMKARKIPYAKIEKNPDGSPKTGLLHSFDIMKSPTKKNEGPGQGKGPLGSVKQGPTGIPFLQGVRVYQKNVGGKVQKGIMTFRIASSKHAGTDRWFHPGLKAKRFFDEAFDWAIGQWEQRILPQVLASLGGE